jgi:hypothetical protein
VDVPRLKLGQQEPNRLTVLVLFEENARGDRPSRGRKRPTQSSAPRWRGC